MDQRPTNGQSSPDGFGGSNSVFNSPCGGSTVDPGNGDSTGGMVSACGDLTVFQWEDSVMYFVMVDRFYDSDNYVDLVDGVAVRDAANGPSGQYVGGDIPGVEAKLPYPSDLGVSAIWLSAPYDNRDYAGGAIDTNHGTTYSAYHGAAGHRRSTPTTVTRTTQAHDRWSSLESGRRTATLLCRRCPRV